MTRGVGSDANPRDGDRVKIEVDLEKASAALARLVRGRARGKALAISLADMTGQVGPIAGDRERCVLTVIGALRAAIVDAHRKAIA